MKQFFMRPFEGLAARVAGTLALALLPIGAVAVFQALELRREDTRRIETELMSATAEAAAGEALAVASASGTSGTLAAHMSGRRGEHDGCSRIFINVIEVKRQYSFAGFVDHEGIVRCASSDVGRDLSRGSVHPRMRVEREQIVSVNLEGPISGTSVILVATPVFDGDTYLGFVSISVPHRRVQTVIQNVEPDETQTAIVTLNAIGQPISSSVGFEAIDNILPADIGPGTIVSGRQFTFTADTLTGQARVFAVAPIIPGVLYALGSQPRWAIGRAGFSTVLFPALMLIAGLAVAFHAVNRLVIRHIRGLIRNMAEFSQTRRIRALSAGDELSRELRAVEVAWTDLAKNLLREEAELEDMVHGKTVLLKEVHHRVKNNLQLIASIVNLKIRRASSEEARRALGEVQMRVRSIAAVHAALYADPGAGRVRADALLASVIDGIISAGTDADRRIEITRRYDQVLLYPDQAVPFLLLASEAATNALKYIGRRADGSAWLRITLEAVSEDRAELEVANTRGTPLLPPEQVQGSGLGRRLMTGFAAQVGGKATVEETEDLYRFHLAFAPASFDPEARDVSIADNDDTGEAGHDRP